MSNKNKDWSEDMLFVLVSWVVIGISAFLWGSAALVLFNRIQKSEEDSVFLRILIGLCALTVYAEIFSLFYKVGMIALTVVLLVDAILMILVLKPVKAQIQELKRKLLSWETLGAAVALIIVLPLSASYINNPDTLLYHAQSIRWIEEFGTVKGIGNLHSRLALDSSFFCLQALFSFRDLAGQSMHSVNGFVAWLMLTYAVCSMKFWRHRRFFASDFLRAAMLFYLNSVSYEFSSPGTDFFAQILTMYLFAEVVTVMEKGKKNPAPYAVLSILSVFAFTLKLSCAPAVLLTAVPAVMLLSQRNWKSIGAYLLAGTVVLAPFCARTFLISGYLFYPMEQIDFFQADWKMPAEVCQYERMRTKAWSEQILGIEELDAPLATWFPYWKAAQNQSTVRLLYADIVCCVATAAWGAIRLKKEKNGVPITVGFVLSVCVAYWFFFAPHIRFGRHFLLMPVFFASGCFLSQFRSKDIAAISLAGMTFLLSAPMLSLLSSARAEERHFIRCIDYELCDTEQMQIGDVTIHIPIENCEAGYDAFPAALDRETAERTEMRGCTIQDGFRPK